MSFECLWKKRASKLATHTSPNCIDRGESLQAARPILPGSFWVPLQCTSLNLLPLLPPVRSEAVVAAGPVVVVVRAGTEKQLADCSPHGWALAPGRAAAAAPGTDDAKEEESE